MKDEYREIRKRRKKKSGKNPFLISVIIIVISLFILDYFLDMPVEFFRALLLNMIVLFIAIYLQIALHEAGHLIFGLATGYGFVSFRLGNLMLTSDGEKIRLRIFSLAGTGGQCLLDPPDLNEGKMPFRLYLLGGVIVNFIAAVISLAILIIADTGPVLSVFLEGSIAFGIAFVILNGIPMRMNMIENDGKNAASLGKKPQAMRAFWIQLKANAETARGTRIRDMPPEWFSLPPFEDMKNSVVATLGYLNCVRLMDQMDFMAADTAITELLRADTGVVPLHRALLTVESIYCELLGENRPERLQRLWGEQVQKVTRAMKNYPSVLRTEYAYALLHDNDTAGAVKIRERFEKIARRYPNPCEIEGERELMACAGAKAGVQIIPPESR